MIFPVDADDLVNCNIAEFFHGRDDKKCYMSGYGFIWKDGSRFFTLAKDLYRTCGSCCAVYYEVDELPGVDYEHRDKTKKYIFQNSHRFLPKYAIAQGKVFGTLPFPSTIYVIGTGENHSLLSGVGISWRRYLEGIIRMPRLLTKIKKAEFNISK